MGREHVFRSSEPFYYLVRRGAAPGTLDVALKQQALASGVDLRFRDPADHLPMGGVVAHGPRHSDAIAVGYVFETDAGDGAFAAVDDQLAPGGYSYLLVHQGRATLASCLFRDFHNEQQYLDRTLEFFSSKLRFTMTDQRRFGGFGNFLLPGSAVQGKLLFAGEAAGFQDPLWGFGMRYAMLSGHLAAQAFLSGSPASYDRLWQERLGRSIRSAVVNRYLYGKLGNRGYRILVAMLGRSRSSRDWLRKAYAPAHWKAALFPLARRSVLAERRLTMDETCDCTWCRCQRDAASAAPSRS
jgi:flavin-dependent dehydrogenase